MLPARIHGVESGSCGRRGWARGIIEKTMAIVMGPVISTPKSGSLQAKQRPSSFLTSWGCGEVTMGSLAWAFCILTGDRVGAGGTGAGTGPCVGRA